MPVYPWDQFLDYITGTTLHSLLSEEDPATMVTVISPKYYYQQSPDNLPNCRDPTRKHHPVLHLVNKANASLPTHMIPNLDLFRKGIGYRDPASILRHLHLLTKPNITIFNSPTDRILDIGTSTTVHKAK